MAGPLPYFKHWQKEYLASATLRRLSLAGHGLLFLLQNYQWEEGYLPDDPEALRRMVGADKKEFDSAWKEVRGLLVADDNCGLIYQPLDDQRKETLDKCEANRNRKGRAAGGRPRDVVDGTRTEPGRNQMVPSDGTRTEHKPEPDTDKPKEETLSDTDNARDLEGEDAAIDAERRFQVFFSWFKANYPKRGPNGIYKWTETERTLRRLVDSGETTTGVIGRGLVAYKPVAESSKDANSDYIPTPVKWLTQGMYLEDYPVILKVEDGGKAPKLTSEETAEAIRAERKRMGL